ncbi:MAG: UDP-3-O-[3-hydroxymyristoyl] N-acetylglucosamine deacetylase [Deltaproteobacteria bacterium]|nr:UDP-3-O-[3-hydroxymyristoyl] N-acetylglucosamine deacetylase [Deltaproteobacteria bacterium]
MFAPFLKEGVGLHTGEYARAVVEMGMPGTGVVFFTSDQAIPAGPDFVSPSQELATTLVRSGKRVATVEHLLAALAAFGETDVRISLEGEEVPILDGSSLPWVRALEEAGAEPGPRFVYLEEEFEVKADESSARMRPIGPEGEPSFQVAIDFSTLELGAQELSFHPLRDDFAAEIAPARTFALESEVDAIQGAGLALGGSLDCALVLGKRGPLNPEGQRFDDEPVRHKMLDALGDLFLLGGLPWAEVTLFKPGHRLLHELVRQAAPHCTPLTNTEKRAQP